MMNITLMKTIKQLHEQNSAIMKLLKLERQAKKIYALKTTNYSLCHSLAKAPADNGAYDIIMTYLRNSRRNDLRNWNNKCQGLQVKKQFYYSNAPVQVVGEKLKPIKYAIKMRNWQVGR